MTFPSFLYKLLILVAMFVGLQWSIHTGHSGIENLVAFVIGFLALAGIICRMVEESSKTFPIPSSWIGRAGMIFLIAVRVVLVVSLIVNEHFLAGFALAVVVLAHWSEYLAVLKLEGDLEDFAVTASTNAFALKSMNEAHGGETSPPKVVSIKSGSYGGVALGQP